jgi:hypothetical protein
MENRGMTRRTTRELKQEKARGKEGGMTEGFADELRRGRRGLI